MPNNNQHLIERVIRQLSIGRSHIESEIEKAINDATEQQKARIVVALAKAGYKDAAKFITLEYDNE